MCVRACVCVCVCVPSSAVRKSDDGETVRDAGEEFATMTKESLAKGGGGGTERKRSLFK